MTPKLGNCQICGRQWGIFVIVCGICRGVDKKQFSNRQNFLKTTQILHKNKDWPEDPRLVAPLQGVHQPTVGLRGGWSIVDFQAGRVLQPADQDVPHQGVVCGHGLPLADASRHCVFFWPSTSWTFSQSTSQNVKLKIFYREWFNFNLTRIFPLCRRLST